MEVKKTFLIPSGPKDGKHLHVVIAIESDEPNILLLSITSQKEGIYHDPACEIKQGVHPFIKHDSYVLYTQARTIGKKKLEKYIQIGFYVPQEEITDDLFNQICNGIEESDHSPPWAIKFYNENK